MSGADKNLAKNLEHAARYRGPVLDFASVVANASKYDEQRVITLNITVYGNESQYRELTVEFDEFDWTYTNVQQVLGDQFNWVGGTQAYACFGFKGQEIIMRGLRERTINIELYDRHGNFFDYMKEAIKDDLRDIDREKLARASKAAMVKAFE